MLFNAKEYSGPVRPSPVCFAPLGDERELTARGERWTLLGIVIAAVALRLVRLGSLSLAGDEETTALAALALLDGWPPTLPGGLVYIRDLPFTFLEAAVVALAGVSEGALRLIPALLSGPRVAAAWWLARPLLGGPLALATAALLALTPLDVEISRVARSYSLFATLDLLFVAAIVHTAVGVNRWWVGTACGVSAVVTHVIAITHAPVVWLAACGRGISGRTRAWLLGTGVAIVATFLGIWRLHRWSYARPPVPGGVRPPDPFTEHLTALGSVIHSPGSVVLACLGVAAMLVLTYRGVRRLNNGLAQLVAVAAALAWLGASPVIGGLLFIGVVVLEEVPLAELWRRAGSLVMAGLVATIAWIGMTINAQTGSGGELKLVARLLLGFPAPNWLGLVQATPAFFMLVLLGILVVTDRAARGDRAGVWLALIAAAVGPSMLIGLVARLEALRFHLHTMAPLIVLALVAGDLLARTIVRSRRLALAVATLLVAASLHADQSLRVVLRDHGPVHEFSAEMKVAPDHRGAAAFVRTRAAPDEWIAAEDPLQHRLLIGRVDVWLRRIEDAAAYLRIDPQGGPPRDIYTGSRHVNDLKALRALALAEGQRFVWLITSGETEALPHYYRTRETEATLREWRPLAWFVGADGLTRVYRLVGGHPVAPPGGQHAWPDPCYHGGHGEFQGGCSISTR